MAVKKWHHIILGILLALSLSVTAVAVTAVPEAVLKEINSVVRIFAEYPDGYATGSGFVILSDQEQTLIATNYHVVEENPYSISVWVGEEETVSASIVAYTSQKDMCILRLEYPVDIASVSLCGSGAKQGAAVYAVGFPSDADYLSDKDAHTGADATITDGIVSALREVTVSGYGTPVKILQINAAINPGNSGGPLFSEKGEVVGINTYGIGDAQGIFGAIAISELIAFAQDSGVALSGNGGIPIGVLLAVAGTVLCIGIVVILWKKVQWKTGKTKTKPAAIVILVILLAVYPSSYLGARVCALAGNMELGGKLLFAPAITRLHDPKFVAYMDGVELLEHRRNSEAKAVFVTLSGYLDADSLAQEADYRYAMQRADVNDFDTAIHLMKTLCETGYKDAAQRQQELQYRQGVYLLYEEGNYKNASKIFKNLIKQGYPGAQEMEYESQYIWAIDLMEQGLYTLAYDRLTSIRDYSDVEESMEVLTELIYQEGQSRYHSGAYSEAETLFNCIVPYADSQKYKVLLDGRSGKIGVVDALIQEFDFEDASEVLLHTQSVAKRFLLGTWCGDGCTFTMKKDGGISYSLPRIDYGDFYKIENGCVLLYPENQENETRKLFTMTAITPDCIEFYCHKDNKIYTLNRE